MGNQTMDKFLDAFGVNQDLPPGFSTVKEFCKAVDAGEVPPIDVLQKCSRAFKRILDEGKLQDGLMFFADELELNKSPGRKADLSTAVADAKLEIALQVLLAAYDHDIKVSTAKKKIAQDRGVSLSTVQHYFKKHESDARWILKNFPGILKGSPPD